MWFFFFKKKLSHWVKFRAQTLNLHSCRHSQWAAQEQGRSTAPSSISLPPWCHYTMPPCYARLHFGAIQNQGGGHTCWPRGEPPHHYPSSSTAPWGICPSLKMVKPRLHDNYIFVILVHHNITQSQWHALYLEHISERSLYSTIYTNTSE